jgi:hypothetical protein
MIKIIINWEQSKYGIDFETNQSLNIDFRFVFRFNSLFNK